MFSFSHLLIGIGFVVAGILMVKYTFAIMNMTGRQEWIEKYTGGGTTYGIFKLFGIVLVLVGLLFATGFGNNLMEFLFSPLVHIFAPGS
jgi:hypothetical protein